MAAITVGSRVRITPGGYLATVVSVSDDGFVIVERDGAREAEGYSRRRLELVETEPACNCAAARGAYGHWLSCERCR